VAGTLADGASVDGAVVARFVVQPITAATVRKARSVGEGRRERIVGMYATGRPAVPAVLGSRPVDAFELDALERERDASGRPYHEFIRTHDLSVGLYVLAAGATDPQGPHTEDEVYHVVAGRGSITVGDEVQPVTAGSIVFVGADVPHRFHDIEEELVVLVVFGPAEYTHRVDHQRGQPHGAAPA
jgi:mannose-6-phosphate isomerase-like protein (cupin superfamily)